MKLLAEKPFDFTFQGKKDRFVEELREEFQFQFESGSVFRKICESAGFEPGAGPACLEDFPFIPVQYFKEAGRNLKIDSFDTHRFLSSSATSGTPSIISVDKETSKRQIRALASVLSDFIGEFRRPFWVCDLEPGRVRNRIELPARLAAVQGFLSFASSREFVLADGDGGPALDYRRISVLKDGLESGKPICVCGFTFLVWTCMLKPLMDDGIAIPLPEGSFVLHIGGWKKLEDRKVSRKVFLKGVRRVFGLPAENVVDVFGFTEQMGTLYPECSHGFKHCPVFADLIVRDPADFRPLPDGGIGVGQFFSLVPHSYPGFSLLTDDLVQVEGRDICPCGRKGTRFKIIGRAESAEIRGCGDILAEKVFAVQKTHGIDDAGATESSFEIRVSDRGEIEKRDLDLTDLKQRMAVAQKQLQQLGVDEILCLLKSAAETWTRDQRFAEYLDQGLSYIVSLLRSGLLEDMIDFSLRGSRLVLDAFTLLSREHMRFRALPRGIVVHWIAGNVPILGFISLLHSVVTKNASVLKVPSSSSSLLPLLIQSIARTKAESVSGKKIDGKVVSDSVAIIYVPRDTEEARSLSRMANARIAWGGAEAVKSIMGLPRRYDAVDIVFGPKISFACIGREALATPSKAKRLARNLSVDISVFEQEACASAHNVFVEKGGGVSPVEFCRYLKEEMRAIDRRMPLSKNNFSLFGRIKSARMRHYLDGEVLAPEGLQWTLLYREKLEWSQPVYGKTAFVRAIDDLEDTARFVSRDNQVVGLALPSPRRYRLAEMFASAGVDRISTIGHMADFSSPWDGFFPIDKLVRWVSLL